MRIGARKKPFYRVVVVDERAKRTGAYVELLGTYNPLTEPKDIKLKKDRIDHWIKQGAQPSTGYLRIIGKAPQRPPRKPRKEKKSEKPENSENQIKSESQKTSESEKSESQTSESPTSSDTSGILSSSESSEKETQSNEKEEVADERSA